jgi:hypothetical protein
MRIAECEILHRIRAAPAMLLPGPNFGCHIPRSAIRIPHFLNPRFLARQRISPGQSPNLLTNAGQR